MYDHFVDHSIDHSIDDFNDDINSNVDEHSIVTDDTPDLTDDFHQTVTTSLNPDGSTDLLDNGVVLHNVPGTELSFHDGQEVIHTNNINGGESTYLNGKEVAHTQPNMMGGTDVYHDGQLAYHTMQTSDGGEMLLDKNMNSTAFSTGNDMGGTNYTSLSGNIDDILNYEDPLEHVDDYRMDSLKL